MMLGLQAGKSTIPHYHFRSNGRYVTRHSGLMTDPRIAHAGLLA
jgi:hypothetical protein